MKIYLGANVKLVIVKKIPEIIPADKSVRLNFYILAASYVLLLLLIEPIISYLLLFDVNQSNLSLINELSEKKERLTYIAYGSLRMLPLLVFAWFGYRILSSAQLPPARMKLPFAVPLKKGKDAKVIGLFLIGLSLLFIAQNISYMINQLMH